MQEVRCARSNNEGKRAFSMRSSRARRAPVSGTSIRFLRPFSGVLASALSRSASEARSSSACSCGAYAARNQGSLGKFCTSCCRTRRAIAERDNLLRAASRKPQHKRKHTTDGSLLAGRASPPPQAGPSASRRLMSFLAAIRPQGLQAQVRRRTEAERLR